MTTTSEQIEFIKTSENVFYRCVEDCTESIMLTNGSGKLIYVNPAWERDYGFHANEALGNTPRLLHSGVHDEAFYAQMWLSILDPKKRCWRGEVVNRAKDGRHVPVLLTITPFSVDGLVSGYMGIALDISEQKGMEKRLAQQDRLASIGVMASGLAHEVGTPLGVIRGRAELLQSKVGDEKILGSLQVIIEQTDRISKLFDSLLRFGRKSDDVFLKEVHLATLCQGCVSMVEPKDRNLNARLDVNVPVDLSVIADTMRLEQVIVNLLMNAYHAISEATKSGQIKEGLIEISAKVVEDNVVIRVQDNGCGMDEEQQHKMFDLFYTTKDVGEGTGLGLAICLKLMQEMNGTINAKSEVNCGTQFELVLPLC